MLSRAFRRACGLGIVVGGIAVVCALATVSAAARHAPRPNLVVNLSATPRPAQVGQNLTYTATVRDYHAQAANVTFRDWIPARSTFVSATASQGSCSGSRPVVCALGTLARGASAKVTVVVEPTANGTIVNSAAVRSDRRDRRPWSNRASIAVGVGAHANLAVGGSASPRPGHVGADLTYTLHVRNLGGSDATNVKVTARVPARSTLVSATASQGSCSGTAPIVCSLGGLAKGASATVTLVAKPTAPGRLVAGAHVHADQRDPRLWNNALRLLTRVLPS